VIHHLNEKLIRRHPHVFENTSEMTSDEVIEQWNKIKQEEKKQPGSVLDSIPKGLPALARAQKSVKRMKGAGFDAIPKTDRLDFSTEDELGILLLSVAAEAKEKGLDAEVALRRVLTHTEHKFRAFEND